jgi:hypothetical protein
LFQEKTDPAAAPSRCSGFGWDNSFLVERSVVGRDDKLFFFALIGCASV